MDEKLTNLLVAGALLFVSFLWSAFKNSAAKNRSKTAGRDAASKRDQAIEFKPDSSDESVRQSYKQPSRPQVKPRRKETAVCEAIDAADETAATAEETRSASVDSETLRQAVKWSIILEKKF